MTSLRVGTLGFVSVSCCTLVVLASMNRFISDTGLREVRASSGSQSPIGSTSSVFTSDSDKILSLDVAALGLRSSTDAGFTGIAAVLLASLEPRCADSTVGFGAGFGEILGLVLGNGTGAACSSTSLGKSDPLDFCEFSSAADEFCGTAAVDDTFLSLGETVFPQVSPELGTDDRLGISGGLIGVPPSNSRDLESFVLLGGNSGDSRSTETESGVADSSGFET